MPKVKQSLRQANRLPNEVKPGSIFTGKWFTGMIEVISINHSENELHVLLTSSDNKSYQWKETWDLELTEIGFKYGDYFWQTDFDGYPEFRLGNCDNELFANFLNWSGGVMPEKSDNRQILIFCNILGGLDLSLGYTSQEAYKELTTCK